jgi:hypothetical protein
MFDARTALKSLVIYAVAITLALLLGYLLANPLDWTSLVLMGIPFLLISAPLMIHYHYPFMLLAWNMGAFLYFVRGSVELWIAAVAVSFAVSFTHRILDKRVRFLSVPQLTKPLLLLVVVVFATAELRGGFGLRSMGGETIGGRRYFQIIMAVLGFFALTARPIPKRRAHRYTALFFLSGVVSAISVLYGRLPNFLNFIFLFIPPSQGAVQESMGYSSGLGFFRPFATVGGTVLAFLFARYGLRQMLAPGRKHLLALLLGIAILTILSGSRLALIGFAMTFAFLFWLEGLWRTRYALILGVSLLVAATVSVPFISKFPQSIQRALAVLPVKVDPVVQSEADASSEWRREIWRVMLPQIPEYLFLGKGYAISARDYNYMTSQRTQNLEAENREATIAGDYHNGPLSIIIPLGVWGGLAFLWLLVASLIVLWRNYRFGDPELANINTFLLASFLVQTITFMFIFGSLYSGLVAFTGTIGYSVALNGGVARRPAPQPYRTPLKPEPLRRRRAPEPEPVPMAG